MSRQAIFLVDKHPDLRWLLTSKIGLHEDGEALRRDRAHMRKEVAVSKSVTCPNRHWVR
jgi:hypothetical protein